jgi:hypothetical protein
MPDGRLRYTMTKPWSDGTHALVFEPLDLIARLAPRGPARHPWPLLMQHVFAKDVLACSRCNGRLRLVEVATTAQAMARVLAHVGLSPRAPRRPPPVFPGQLALSLG